MKQLVSLLFALVLSTFCLGQTHDPSFRYIIGRNPNSPELRVRMQVSRRNLHRSPAVTNSKQSVDWALSTGISGGGGPVSGGAIWANGLSPNCANDLAIMPIKATPAVGGQANVVVYNQLYSGSGGLCGGGAASVFGAYAIGSNPLSGSIALSLTGGSAGQKIAVLERATAKVHVLSIASGGTVTAAAAPTGETIIDYTNITNSHCTAGTTHTANSSDIWIDYSTDEAYVADDGGKLYHLTGVFNGSPAMDFCTTLLAGVKLGYPEQINSSGTDYVFTVGNGQTLFRTQVNPGRTAFITIKSLKLATNANSIADTPIYDSGADIGYVWSNSDFSVASPSQSSLFQVNMLTTPMTVASDLNLGPAAVASGLSGEYFDGEFDNTFYSSGAGAAGATGYTCRNPNGTAGSPQLASFQFNASGIITGFTAMGANTHINQSTGTAGNICVNMIESFDPAAGVDQLFVSTGNGTNANTDALRRFDITTPLTSNAATFTASSNNNAGGVSNIVLDWLSSGLGGQTQNMYFGTLAAPATTGRCGGALPNFNYCHVKLQQSTLN